jgi:hypothetical protein
LLFPTRRRFGVPLSDHPLLYPFDAFNFPGAATMRFMILGNARKSAEVR